MTLNGSLCVQRPPIVFSLDAPPASILTVQPPSDDNLGAAALYHYTWGELQQASAHCVHQHLSSGPATCPARPWQAAMNSNSMCEGAFALDPALILKSAQARQSLLHGLPSNNTPVLQLTETESCIITQVDSLSMHCIDIDLLFGRCVQRSASGNGKAVWECLTSGSWPLPGQFLQINIWLIPPLFPPAGAVSLPTGHGSLQGVVNVEQPCTVLQGL